MKNTTLTLLKNNLEYLKSTTQDDFEERIEDGINYSNTNSSLNGLISSIRNRKAKKTKEAPTAQAKIYDLLSKSQNININKTYLRKLKANIKRTYKISNKIHIEINKKHVLYTKKLDARTQYLENIENTDFTKAKYVASWSGGKDSTFMIDELLRKGEPLDLIVFCDTGYEFHTMYEYIEKVETYWKKKYPKLKIVKLNYKNNGSIWKTWAETEFQKGDNKGKKRGMPYDIGMSWCTRELKVNPFNKFVKDYFGADTKYFQYVGIAFDEPARIREDNELYPMVKWKIRELKAAKLLIERELHNPLYNIFHRTGCFLCPKQSLASLYKVWKHYKDEWNIIVNLINHYKNLGCAIDSIKNFSIEELETKFQRYDKNGKQDYWLEQQPIGCFCK